MRVWKGETSMMECERLVYAGVCGVLRRQGKVEEVIARGEALMQRWMEAEVGQVEGGDSEGGEGRGWSTWPWLIGCAVDVWSRGERELRERHEAERKRHTKEGEEKGVASGGGGGKDGAADDGADADSRRLQPSTLHQRGSSIFRALSPERRRRDREAEAQREKASIERKAQEERERERARKKLERRAERAAANAADGKRKDGSQYQLTQQVRQLHADRTTFMFTLINRLLGERQRRRRRRHGDGELDLLGDDGVGWGEWRRAALEADAVERRRLMDEWRQRKGEELVLGLDEEVISEELYHSRQEKLSLALIHLSLFPVLLHSLLSFASTASFSPSSSSSSSPLHVDHFLALHARVFSALSLSSFSSALFLHLSSLYFTRRFHALSLHHLRLRLREDLTAHRPLPAIHSLTLLLALHHHRWLDIRQHDVPVALHGWPPTLPPASSPISPASPPHSVGSLDSIPSIAALLRHVCETQVHAGGTAGVGREVVESEQPAFHLFRALVPSPTSPLSLPLPRPSIPSPPALTSLLRRSVPPAHASSLPAKSSAVVGPVLVVSLTSVVAFQSVEVRLCPYAVPFRLSIALRWSSLLHSVELDDVAFTLRVTRDGEGMEIDLEYHHVHIAEGEQLTTLTAALVDTSSAPPSPSSPSSSSSSLPSHHSCKLQLDPADYALLLSLLSSPSPSSLSSSSLPTLELAHIWCRFSRLHLLWWDKQPVLDVLTFVIDSTPTSSPLPFSPSSPSSPRSSTSHPSLHPLPSTRSFLLGGDAEALLLLLTTQTPSPSSSTLHLLVEGATVITALAILHPHDDSHTPPEERRLTLMDHSRIHLGPVPSDVSVFVQLLLHPPLVGGCSSPVLQPVRFRLMDGGYEREGGEGVCVAQCEEVLRGVPAFVVSSSVVHLGHRLFVVVSVRCCSSGVEEEEEEGGDSMYRVEEARVEWMDQWHAVRSAEDEVRGVMLDSAGDGALQLMYELEEQAADDDSPQRGPQDGVVHLRCRVLSSPTASSSVSASFPLSFPPTSLVPPALHVIIAAPSAAALGEVLALSVTVLLSSSTALPLPLSLLCELVPTSPSSFLLVGLTSNTFTLSSAASSHTLTAQLVPITAGLLSLPDIRLCWKGMAGGDGGSGRRGGREEEDEDEEAQWQEVDAMQVKRHFGQERVQVEPRGLTRCDMRRMEPSSSPSSISYPHPIGHPFPPSDASPSIPPLIQ